MAQQNKVAANIQQDFTAVQQSQARKNISATNMKFRTGSTAYGPVYTTADSVSISDTTHSMYVDFGDGNMVQYEGLVPVAASGDNSKVLTVLDDLGTYEWAEINAVPASGITGQVLTKTSTGYDWQYAYQPLAGYNLTQRTNESTVYRPYFDCNYVVKCGYQAMPSMYADKSAHEREFNLANGQIRCKVSYLAKDVNDDYNSIRFQFKVNTGRELVIYGTYHDNMSINLPDSMNVFNSAIDDTYIGLYSTAANDYVGLSRKTANDTFAESIELHLAWVNTKNFRMETRLFITRFHNANIQQSDSLTIYDYYSTLTNASV